MKKFIMTIAITILILLVLCSSILFLFPIKYTNLIDKYSKEFSVDKVLVASVINIESGYDKNALSPAGAIGLMQLLPSTAFEAANKLDILVDEEDLKDPETNICLGVYYLSYLLKMFDNNFINSLCAYNWGFNNVRNWITQGNTDDNGTIINIPVKETSDYIKKYKLNKFIYEKIYKM